MLYGRPAIFAIKGGIIIIVTGSVPARADTADVLLQASQNHVLRSHNKVGCLLHSVQVDCENPRRLFFYEPWRDLASLRVHATVAGSRTFIAAVRALAESSEPISVYETAAVAL